jgi:DNA-binding NtrC family response regulator
LGGARPTPPGLNPGGNVAHILLIDDDLEFAGDLARALTEEGHQVRILECAEDALRLLAAGEAFDLVLLDNRMPRMTGLEFLAALKKQQGNGPGPPVILMTNAHHDGTAIQAINLGAFAYVLKADPDDMLDELAPLIDKVPRPIAAVPISEEPPRDEEKSLLVGRSKPMIELLMRIARLSQVDETVLILGETGTGKDLVARALHTNSRRRNGPFVVMNCGAFNEQLLDDELFGHEIGAFTGAAKLRKGRFEHASGGTLFLDEVGDMPGNLQVKLLRVLENREVTRIGSNDPIAVDVRVLAATHRNLPDLVRQGKFREDLMYRLEGMTIHLPPLRDRKGDVELLAQTFLARMFPERQSRPTLHPLALQMLRDYHWPGNVRQLQKVLCRAAGRCWGLQILPGDIDFGELHQTEQPAPAQTGSNDRGGLHGLVEAAWREGKTNILEALTGHLERELLDFGQQLGLNQVQLAARLGVSRNYLRKLLDKHGFTEPREES